MSPRLALSFDKGPFPDVTPAVPDALAARKLSASLFVCGQDLRDPARRAPVERARAAGHRIGNHTLPHTVELGATREADAPAREIGGAQVRLGALASPGRWLRPYGAGGALGPRLLDALLERGIVITDELPPSCVPIRDGAWVGSLTGLVATSESGWAAT